MNRGSKSDLNLQIQMLLLLVPFWCSKKDIGKSTIFSVDMTISVSKEVTPVLNKATVEDVISLDH